MAAPGSPGRVLILGGAGFIGSHIAAAFVRRGARVTVVDGFLPDTAAREANLAGLATQVELARTRIEDCPDLMELVREAELAVDCMGLTGHHIGMAEPLRDLELNLRSHVVLIEALRKVRGARVIYLGSRGQYGRGIADPITEETPQMPLDPQGVHKLAAEGLFRVYAHRGYFHAISLRLSNTYGEHQRTRGYDLGLVGGFLRDLLAIWLGFRVTIVVGLAIYALAFAIFSAVRRPVTATEPAPVETASQAPLWAASKR